MTKVACLTVGFLFFIRDPKNGWPFLAAGFCFPLNDAIYSLLTSLGLIDPLTEIVASMSQALTFIAAFALLFSLLAATALPRRTTISGSPVGVVSPTAKPQRAFKPLIALSPAHREVRVLRPD